MENQLPQLSTKEIWNEMLKFFNLEKGLLFTFVSLLKTPKLTVNTYLRVDRKKYSNPLQYILFGAAIYIVLLKVSPSFNAFLSKAQEMNTKNYGRLEERFNISIIEPFTQAQDIYLSYQNLLYLIIIPVVGILTYQLHKPMYNFAENMVINAYAFGTVTWISILASLVTIFTVIPYAFFILSALITFFTLTYLYKKIYDTSWLMGLLTAILSYIGIIVLSTIIQGILFVILIF